MKETAPRSTWALVQVRVPAEVLAFVWGWQAQVPKRGEPDRRTARRISGT
jgi:hypothetical protein